MKQRFKNIILGAVVVIVIVAGGYFTFRNVNHVTNESLPISETVATPGGSIDIRVARTDAERELGLSYFKALPTNQGMLFVFDDLGIYPFWMKEMTFSIDIVWLRSVGGGTGTAYAIDSVTYSATPESYPETFRSIGPVDAVLEIPAGEAQFKGLSQGTYIMVRKDGYSKSGVPNP